MTKVDNNFKYEIILNWIKDGIEAGLFKEGDKINSESEIVNKFNASRITVRKAINILCEEGVVYKIKGSGTFIASRKRNRPKKYNIAVLTSYITDYVFTSIMRGIESVATQEGYTLSMGITEYKYSKEAQFIKSMLDKGVDGFIIESIKSVLPNPNINLYRELDKNNVPYVFINSYYKELDPVYVVTDDENVGYQAVKYLYSLGHRKIAGIFKMDEIQGIARYKGYNNGLYEYGLETDDANVLWFHTDTEANYLNPIYDEIILKKFEGCTAIVCYSDLVVYNLMRLFDRHNINVPDDISIIGVDNSSISELQGCRITTFAHPKEKLGREAAKKLIKMINTGEREESSTLHMNIIKRDSTKSI